MPTYDYRCDSCGHQLDAVQRMSDDPLSVCPACGRPELVKQISPVGFQLKGTGWYVTDFRDKGKAAAKKVDGDGDTAPETKPAEGKTGEPKADETKSAETKSTETKDAARAPDSGGKPAAAGTGE